MFPSGIAIKHTVELRIKLQLVLMVVRLGKRKGFDNAPQGAAVKIIPTARPVASFRLGARRQMLPGRGSSRHNPKTNDESIVHFGILSTSEKNALCRCWVLRVNYGTLA